MHIVRYNLTMQSKLKDKRFFYALLALAAIGSAIIFWPFMTVIIISMALSVVLHPVYEFFKRKLRGISWLASLVTVLLFIIVLGVPLFFIGSRVLTESQSLYLSVADGNGSHGAISSASTFIKAKIPAAANFDLNGLLARASSFLADTFSTILTTTLSTAFALVLALLSLFYFLKDGDYWKARLIRLSPLTDKHDSRILAKLGSAVNGVMLGYIMIALVQGLLMGLGLWLFGVPNAVLWGTLAGIASMIPSIGTALVSGPAIIYLFMTGPVAPAIGLLIWALTLVGGIDNILNPIVVGKRIELPPVMVLFAVLGGIALMGAPGIIIGPLAVSLLHTLIDIYQDDFESVTSGGL